MSGMGVDSGTKALAESILAVGVTKGEAILYHSIDVGRELILQGCLQSCLLGEHNGVPARDTLVNAGAAGGTFVHVVHYLRKVDSLTVDQGQTQGSGSGGASLLSRGVADGADVMTHPAEAAGIYMLFAFFRHYHSCSLLIFQA